MKNKMLKELLDKLVGQLPGVDSLANFPASVLSNIKVILLSTAVVVSVVIVYNLVT